MDGLFVLAVVFVAYALIASKLDRWAGERDLIRLDVAARRVHLTDEVGGSYRPSDRIDQIVEGTWSGGDPGSPRSAQGISSRMGDGGALVDRYIGSGGEVHPQMRRSRMLVALLAVLGVDLIVLLALIGVVLVRKRWVVRQPGAFRGKIRVASGEIDGLRSKWSRGYGRWVRDVLVWTKAPSYFRNELLASDGLDAEGPADPDKVKRLGDQPVVIRLRTGGATAEVAAHGDDHELLLGPYRKPAGATDSGVSAPGNAPLSGERPPSGGHRPTI